MSARTVFVACALACFAGCSFVVSTSGLAGDGDAVDAGVDTGSADATDDRGAIADGSPADAGDASADVSVDADASDGRILWSANGHRYEIRVYAGDKSWTETRDDAVMSGGHLATITSASEEAFVWSLLDARPDAFDGNYGPWIGGYQPNPNPNDGGNEPHGGWAWVTGEAWSYSHWRVTEPNNTGNDEHFLHYFKEGEAWNDIANSPGFVRSAVIEYE